MSVNTNTWNRIRYSLYAPVYNAIRGVFANARKESINNLNIQSGERVLIVGAGTGLDLPYLPSGAVVTATDITPAMITKVESLTKEMQLEVKSLVMDGQNLAFPNAHFDHVILHLILAVIPDPKKCIHEVDRVTKPGGKVAVFDKFIPAHSQPSILRKMGNALTTLLFSDITRDIYSISLGTSFQVVSDVPRNFKGMFRVITLEK